MSSNTDLTGLFDSMTQPQPGLMGSSPQQVQTSGLFNQNSPHPPPDPPQFGGQLGNTPFPMANMGGGNVGNMSGGQIGRMSGQMGNMGVPMANIGMAQAGTMGSQLGNIGGLGTTMGPQIGAVMSPGHTGNIGGQMGNMAFGTNAQQGYASVTGQMGPYGGQIFTQGDQLYKGQMYLPVRSAPLPPSLQLQVPQVSSQNSVASQPQHQSSGSPGNLILSSSFTEPGPVEDDLDPLGQRQSPVTVESKDVVTEPSAVFYIEEEQQVQEQPDEQDQDLEQKDEEEEKKDEEATTPTPAPRKSFFSMFSRSKEEGGSQEKNLEDKDEADGGRGGNEQKFMGEGQTFKGKLIGVLEVRDARGDRMCQDALQELKMAIKASGEHKQKINIQIAVDGLKIRDEKSGDCLYHHPVHKISFIAQDMTDIRAFGYIYGSPENGHRFFGIKTEKAAGQVVVAMRDLFQVVFELKKKEIEEAKQSMDSTEEKKVTSAASFPEVPSGSSQGNVDDLLGLESEISAIQAGIQQIDKITPTPPMSFQTDSMIPFSLSSAKPPQQTAPAVPPQPRKPVAVMNPNPPKADGFGTAPFLPPPPSKSGKRDDRYAALESIAPQAPAQFPDTGIADQVPSIFTTPPVLGDSQSSGSFSGVFSMGDFSKQPQQPVFPPSSLDQSSFSSSPASSFTAPSNAAPGFSTAAFPPQPAPAFPEAASSNIFPTQPDGFSSQTGIFPPPQIGGFSDAPSSNPTSLEIQGKTNVSKLDSLFTDLDPLGTGKSKPYTDKKDFFANRTSPKTGMGSSKESLSNVGFEDSLWENCPNTVSELSLTNTVPSTSFIPCHSTQRRISENSLRVALPPEEGRLSVSPGEHGLNPQSSYGSILELEASPRRYRNSELHDMYAGSQDSPPYSTKYGDNKDSSVDSSLNIPMPMEPPPALPERPPKSISLSPPPLPPKKQTYQMSAASLNSHGRIETGGTSRDLYDYAASCTPDLVPNSRYEPSPMLNASVSESLRKSPEISVSDLVKMNVMELSQKLAEGKLPEHLSGMSLFELVEYIGKQSHQDRASPLPKQGPDLVLPSKINSESKPCFDDSFTVNHSFNEPAPKVEERHQPPVSAGDNFVTGMPPYQGEGHFSGLDSSSYSIGSYSKSVIDTKSIGFDDNFSQFQPLSSKDSSRISVNSDLTSSQQTDTYDKYAVFRELQLEEELVNAWKSPTEETSKDIPTENSEEIGVENINEEVNDEAETYFDTNESQTYDDEKGNIECSRGISPESKSDSREVISSLADLDKEKPCCENGGDINISTSDKEPTHLTPEETKGKSVENANNNVNNDSTYGWASFEEASEKNFEFSSFLSKDEQERILGTKSLFKTEFMRKDSYTKLTDTQADHTEDEDQETRNKFSIQSPKSLRDLPSTASFQARYQNFKRFDQTPSPKSPKASFKNQRLSQEEDPFEAEWEPAFYTRNFADGDGYSKPQTWDLSFQSSDSGRQRRPTGKHSNLEEAFPAEKLKSGRSSRASSENMFNNPFNDNFVTNNNVRTASATPPVFEGDRISNASDLSFQSGDIINSTDIFDRDVELDDRTFKIEAKTKVTKSDSVNIFSTADDPFDDDFFK